MAPRKSEHRITFFLAPLARDVGLTSMALGLVRALQRDGVKIGFVKPIAHPADLSAHFARTLCRVAATPDPIPLAAAEQRLRAGETSGLMEDVVRVVEEARAGGCDAVLAMGLPLSSDADDAYLQLAQQLNARMARALGAYVIPVISGAHCHARAGPGALAESIEIVERQFTDEDGPPLAGFLINKMPESETPVSSGKGPNGHGHGHGCGNGDEDDGAVKLPDPKDLIKSRLGDHVHVPLLGAVPFDSRLNAPRLVDVVSNLGLKILRAGGDMAGTRVYSIVKAARSAEHMLEKCSAGALVVTPGDRVDIILATVLAFVLGRPVAGLILTCGEFLPPHISSLIMDPRADGLPILTTDADTFVTSARLAAADYHLYSADDPERIDQMLDFAAEHMDTAPLTKKMGEPGELRLTPPAFRNRLVEMAREAHKRIILPEADEPRTLRAADICQRKGIARCVLLGNPAAVHKAAAAEGLTLPLGIEIINPDAVRERYVQPMIDMRRGKGLTRGEAAAQLRDTVVLGTVMLSLGEVDGLVSGAVHTTASTVRPALQLIKTSAAARLVSSVFFMLMPDQVLVFGDCAINPSPSARELADIALQSADSAAAFGVEPRVAMISYASGTSAAGAEVSKVREATALARAARPGLLVDGPMQYDAASVASVGRQKMPDSAVAGRANVFVFPDLNTGNTAYKAVQRSARVVSIGPVLQGLRKPVNDLSRGSSVDDIVYTIALTTIQACGGRARPSPERGRRPSLDREALYGTLAASKGPGPNVAPSGTAVIA